MKRRQPGTESLRKPKKRHLKARSIWRSTEDELREAQRVAHLGSWEWNPKSDEVRWSEELYRIAGRDPNLPPPKYEQHSQLYTPQSWERLRTAVDTCLSAGTPYELDLELVRPDATIRWIAARGEAELDDNNIVTRLRGTAQDITENKRLADQLQQVQRLETIGQLAGGIAHDFNNLLGVILGHSEVLEQRGTNDRDVNEHVMGIRAAANRAAALTRQLLAFSRKQVMRPRPINLNSVVENISGMLRTLGGERIELVFELSSDLRAVNADADQIERVLMNLAINARDAMPEGGTLKIVTKNTTIDRDYILGHPPVIPGEYVMFSVTDTGTGMDQQTAARLFEPFFTTKELGKGTGLGLSITYGIVKQSRGYIWVYSEPKRGSTFKVYLPQIQHISDLQLPVERSDSVGVGPSSETILLVEDEEALRDIFAKMLESGGYRVLVAAGAREALEISGAHEGQIALLLTDIMLRGSENGYEVARETRRQRPHIKVLYMSGYTAPVMDEHAHEAAALLDKPFSARDLHRKIRDLLGGGP